MKFLPKHFLLAPLLCVSLISDVVLAYTSYSPPPVSLLLSEPGMSFCHEGGPCTAPWTSLDMPLLTTNQIVPISTNSTDFNYYLGNSLSGTYKVSLYPSHLVASLPTYDELRANLASATVIGTTSNGNLTFSTSSGIPYYLLLSGLVRGGETYSLSVSAVPETEQYLLLIAGLGVLALRVSKKNKL